MSLSCIILPGCREDVVVEETVEHPTEPVFTAVDGFYLLNEGNLGNNKCSLDYFDAITGNYHKNIYQSRNPNVVKELGDVGNDLEIYGTKLYAVINASHKVEVMRAADAVRITQVDIPNCRYIVGNGGYVYVSSYVGSVQVDPNAPKGAVFKVDTLNLNIVDRVEVGYQPEEMTVIGNKMYVANSGGYRKPSYDRTVSVIDLDKFKVVDVIEVPESANFHHLVHDRKGRLWLSSRGDYTGEIASDLLVIDPRSKKVVKKMGLPVGAIWVDDDYAYVISSAWRYGEQSGFSSPEYIKINMSTMEIEDRSLIKDETIKRIKTPYGIAVNPITKELYLTDAKNYLTGGTLYCFGQDGRKKWEQSTGQIPAHFAFKGVVEQQEVTRK